MALLRFRRWCGLPARGSPDGSLLDFALAVALCGIVVSWPLLWFGTLACGTFLEVLGDFLSCLGFWIICFIRFVWLMCVFLFPFGWLCPGCVMLCVAMTYCGCWTLVSTSGHLLACVSNSFVCDVLLLGTFVFVEAPCSLRPIASSVWIAACSSFERWRPAGWLELRCDRREEPRLPASLPVGGPNAWWYYGVYPLPLFGC